MKPVIIAIVGPSGCGKTTMAEYVQETFGIPTIVSYTTRPMRDNEQQGKEHIFVSDNQMPPMEEMMAFTEFGGHKYWATHKQIPEQKICTYVIDEKGLFMLSKKYGYLYSIFTILVKMDSDKLQADSSRIERDNDRIALDETEYQLVITNNGTLDEFLQNVKQILENEFKNNPIFSQFNIQ